MEFIRTALEQQGLDPSLAPLITGLLIVQIVLQVAALVDLLRRPHVTLGDRKWLWAIIIVIGESIGALLYFALGRVKYAPTEQARPLVDMDVAEAKAQAIVDKLYGKSDQR